MQWKGASRTPTGLRRAWKFVRSSAFRRSSTRPARVQLAGGWRVRRTGVRLFLEKEAS